jgi:drug/metabolite transporter (DMT)-like permease
MDSITLALVLIAAGFHAGWNRLLHDVPDRTAALAVAGLGSGIILLPAILLTPPTSVLPLVGLSALAETGYALFLAAAYRRGALSLAYPIGRGTAPLLVTLGGWAALGLQPRPETIAGAATLCFGLVIVATTAQATARAIAVGFAVATGASIAAYSLIDSQAVHHTSPAGYLGLVLALQGFMLTGWIRADGQRLQRALKPGVLIAIGSVVAYLLVLLAFQRANAGRVATLRELSVLIGLLLARDQPRLRVWIGGALVVAGAGLVVL